VEPLVVVVDTVYVAYFHMLVWINYRMLDLKIKKSKIPTAYDKTQKVIVN
jgi:hypothetical protein